MKYQDGHYYHVYNRGAHKERVFYRKANYDYCLSLMERYSNKYQVGICAYCLMPNHYHLLLKQYEGGSISRFIQTVFNAYSQSINLERRHSGTFFQGKAKSKLVDADNYFMQLVRYIHHNPVEAGIVPSAELWKFSDCGYWTGKHQNSITDPNLPTLYFDSAEEYEKFLREYEQEMAKKNLERYLLD